MSYTELGESETVRVEYEGCRVVKDSRSPGETPKFRFESAYPNQFTPKDTDTTTEWDNPNEAELYAAVYSLTLFREEKTGRRGIPPEVQRFGQEAVISYLSAEPGISTDWLTTFYDLDRERIYEYRSRIRSMAETKADGDELED